VPAIIAYEGVGRELLARLKYRDARQAVAPLADAVAARVSAGRIDTSFIGTSFIDTVTWIPTTDRRRRERGFDQAELLARAVARRLGRPSYAYDISAQYVADARARLHREAT